MKEAKQEPGKKYDAGKPRLELISRSGEEGLARVLTMGAQKYDAWNWYKGMSWSRLLGAMKRHTAAFAAGENLDPESGLPHIDHVQACAHFLSTYFHERLGVDDRQVQKGPEEWTSLFHSTDQENESLLAAPETPREAPEQATKIVPAELAKAMAALGEFTPTWETPPSVPPPLTRVEKKTQPGVAWTRKHSPTGDTFWTCSFGEIVFNTHTNSWWMPEMMLDTGEFTADGAKRWVERWVERRVERRYT
jgi:hypothetical protein